MLHVENNLDLFNWLINNWQRDRFTKEALSEFYHNYSEQVKYAKSVIDIIELIKKLKQFYLTLVMLLI